MRKETFLSRIVWDTSQLLRKSFTSLKALTLLLVLCLSIGNAWGATKKTNSPYTCTFASGDLKTASGTVTKDSVTWTYPSATYIGWDANKGIQIGSSKNCQSSYSLKAPISDFVAGATVTKVVVNASMGSNGNAKLTIKVGDKSLEKQALTTFATDYTLDKCSATSKDGDIVVSFSATSKAYYIKSITVYFTIAAAQTTVTLTAGANGSVKAYSDAARQTELSLDANNQFKVDQSSTVYFTATPSSSTYVVDTWTGATADAQDNTKASLEVGTDDTKSVNVTFKSSSCTSLGTPTVTATPSVKQVQLSWNPVANASSYSLVWNDGEAETVTSPVTKSDLVGGQEYTYSLMAVGDGTTYCAENTPAEGKATPQKAAATITLNVSGQDPQSIPGHNEGDEYTLPDCTAECGDKVFTGWSTSEITQAQGDEPTTGYYKKSDKVTLAATNTFYAVFADKDDSGQTSSYTLNYDPDVKNTTPAYGSSVDVTATDGSKWVVKAYKNSGMQINIGKNASIKIPTCPSNITSIEIVGSAAKAVGLCDNDYTGSGTITYIVSGTDAKSQTLDLSNVSVTGGYIVAKSGSISITKIVVNYATYTNYSTTCNPVVVEKPVLAPAAGEYWGAQNVKISNYDANNTYYYTLDGDDPTASSTQYSNEDGINVTASTTLKVIGKKGDDYSAIASAGYTIKPKFNSLEGLAAADLAKGTEVQVTFVDQPIKSFYVSGDYTNGVYFDIQKGGKDIEIYYQNVPSAWKVGGKLSGTMTCPWTEYSGTWELAPAKNTWGWDSLTYTDPAVIDTLIISGDVTTKSYSDGQQLNPAGLTVVGYYNDHTELAPHKDTITEGLTWVLPTLSEDQTSAKVSVKYTEPILSTPLSSAEYQITGLSVSAAKVLDTIYVASDSEHQTDFFVGRPFSSDGLKVMAHYNIGDDQVITPKSISTPNMLQVGKQAITITYEENSVEKYTTDTINITYMDLNDLVAADIASGTKVYVKFTDVAIKDFYKTNGVYFDIQKGGKDIEIYSSTAYPTTWVKKGTISATLNDVEWYDYNGTWELKPSNWSAFNYTAPTIPTTGIAFDPATVTVKETLTKQMEVVYTPEDATNKGVTWSVVSGSEYVSIDSVTGILTALDAGDAVIKATLIADNSITATCAVTVEELPEFAPVYTSNVAVGTDTVIINDVKYEAKKAGSSGTAGVTSVKVPAGATALHFHACAWNADDVQLTVTMGETTLKAAFALYQDAGFKGSTPFTLQGGNYPVDQFYSIELTNVATDTTITFTANSGRFLLYGVNKVGGAEINGIYVTGEATELVYNEGDVFNPAGLKVMATYTVGDAKEIASGYTFTYDPATLATTTTSVDVTAHYKEFDSQAFTVSNLTVNHLVTTALELSGTYPTRFNVGDAFSHEGLTIQAVMSNKSKKDVSELATITDPDMTTPGKKQVAVSYNEADTFYMVVVLDASTVFYESFDTNLGSGGNDGLWSGNDIAKDNIKSDNEGWDFTSAKGANKCAKFGAGSTLGSAQTPEIAANSDTAFVITFRAGAWDGNSEVVGLKISTTSGTLSDTSVTMAKAAFTSYTITLTGVTKDFQISFAAAQKSNNRFFLDEVMVQKAYVRNLTSSNIGTVCLPKAASIESFAGATFFEILDKDATGKNVTFQEVTTLEAGMPYIFQPAEESSQIILPLVGTEEATAQNNNGLYGWLSNNETFDYQIDSKDVYFVNGGKIKRCGNNCIIAKNRAYIVLDEIGAGTPAPGRRRMTLGVEGNNTPTGLDLVGETELGEPQKLLIDNQIIIIRNGKMFNAQGQVVK